MIYLNLKAQIDNKEIILVRIYKRIIFFEWFAVAGLAMWLLFLFTTILH